MKFAWLIAFAVVFSACAPRIAPPGPGPATPELNDSQFLTSDGLTLPVRAWVPDSAPLGLVVAVHGFNDYSKSFDTVPNAPGVGPTLSGAGYIFFAYDQRGFGRAPHAGLWPGDDVLVQDFSDFVRVLDQTYPDIPVYALGVSMGGAVITAAMTSDTPPPVDAAVLVAPAVWSRNTMPALYRFSLWLGARLFPNARPSGRSLERQASDNIKMLRDNARDPLFIKETRIDSIQGLSNLMDRAQANIGRMQTPTLYLYGAKDEIIPKNATRAAVAKFVSKSANKRLAYYENGWHMMLRDLQAETVLGDIAAYLTNPELELPSGADFGAQMRLDATE